MLGTILHIGACGPIMNPFVIFLKNNFDFQQHEFLLTKTKDEPEFAGIKNVNLAERKPLARIRHLFLSVFKMHQAKKVIIHGLFDPKLVVILFFTPWLLKKCYWVMWGGDLYIYELGERDWRWSLREFFRRPVIRNMGYLVAYTKGEVSLAQKWYGCRGQHIRCFFYTSNLYSEYHIASNPSSCVKILAGNSADPSNNHLEIFENLEKFKDQDIKIYAPLTYGNSDYAKIIIEQGVKKFGCKFIPLTEHMSFDQYVDFLADIDIAIFSHNRQQAMGTIRTLIGLGKKVYMKQYLTSAISLKEDGVKVFDIKHITLTKNFLQRDKNILRVKELFSHDRLVRCLSHIWENK